MNSISKSSALFFILIIAISSLSLLLVKPATAQSITSEITVTPIKNFNDTTYPQGDYLSIKGASSSIIAETVFAQSIPKPSVPEFTIEPVGPSFDIPPTYSFNSSSGFFYVNEGYHFEFSTVEVIIKNQAFTNQTNIDYLLYNVRLKPHNYPDSYWQELFNPNLDGFPIQTSSNFTIIPIAAEGATELQYQIAAGATTDVQVKAMIGHIERGFNGNATNQIEMYPYVFVGQTSDWSNTYTVTLPPKVPITVSSPTPTPTVPEFPVLVILPFFVSVFLVAVYFKHRRTNHE